MQSIHDKKGILFVISGPSGVGKSTLCNELVKSYENLIFSISYTTRKKREQEVNGKEYFFVTKDEFNLMIKENKFLEWAKVHNNYYGTSLGWIEKQISLGNNVLLDIDVQGAETLKKKCKNAVFIFVTPPSFNVLKNRILDRNTEKHKDIDLRLKNAQSEMSFKNSYDYVVENDIVEKALVHLKNIFDKKMY